MYKKKPKKEMTPIGRVMSAIGSSTSPEKRAASRENGKKGGRPKNPA